MTKEQTKFVTPGTKETQLKIQIKLKGTQVKNSRKSKQQKQTHTDFR